MEAGKTFPAFPAHAQRPMRLVSCSQYLVCTVVSDDLVPQQHQGSSSHSTDYAPMRSQSCIPGVVACDTDHGYRVS